MPLQFSDLGEPLARIRPTGCRHPFGTDTLCFQNGSQPNVPLHHPNFVEALETLYLIKGRCVKESKRLESRETRLTRKFSRITCQNLIDESSLIHLYWLIIAGFPLSWLGKISA